jgi:hypothetical protein
LIARKSFIAKQTSSYWDLNWLSFWIASHEGGNWSDQSGYSVQN